MSGWIGRYRARANPQGGGAGARRGSRSDVEEAGRAGSAPAQGQDGAGLVHKPYLTVEGVPEREERSTRRAYATLTSWPEGSLVRLKGRRITAPDPEARAGRRGLAGRFEGRVRLNLLRKLATVRRDVIPLFGHVTYSDDLLPVAWPRHKRNLHVMGKAMLRTWPRCAVFWRTGWAIRKSGVHEGEAEPHGHCLIYGVPGVPLVAFATLWANVCGPVGKRSKEAWAKHVAAGTTLDRAKSAKRAGAYMAKSYLAKGSPEPAPEHYGRTWGVIGRRFVPWSSSVEVLVPWKAFHPVRRLIARGAGRRLAGAFPWQGLTVFSEGPGAYLRLGSSP